MSGMVTTTNVETACEDFQLALRNNLYPELFLDLSTGEIFCHIDLSENDRAWWYNPDFIDISQLMAGENPMESSMDAEHYFTPENVVIFLTTHDKSLYKDRIRDAREIANRMREADEWEMGDCETLCALAGMQREWQDATSDNFEAVLYRAADRLGVNIL